MCQQKHTIEEVANGAIRKGPQRRHRSGASQRLRYEEKEIKNKGEIDMDWKYSWNKCDAASIKIDPNLCFELHVENV